MNIDRLKELILAECQSEYIEEDYWQDPIYLGEGFRNPTKSFERMTFTQLLTKEEDDTSYLNEIPLDVVTVLKVTDPDTSEVCFVKFSGIHDSWGGPEWNEPMFVKPVEKTVIVYE